MEQWLHVQFFRCLHFIIYKIVTTLSATLISLWIWLKCFLHREVEFFLCKESLCYSINLSPLVKIFWTLLHRWNATKFHILLKTLVSQLFSPILQTRLRVTFKQSKFKFRIRSLANKTLNSNKPYPFFQSFLVSSASKHWQDCWVDTNQWCWTR